MKTLLSLISEQTLPNILFAKEKGSFERYVFISTLEMEKPEKQKTKAILKVLALDTEKEVVLKIVQEDSVQDIQAKLAEIDFQADEQITVNLTGGNKVMGLAVYAFFTQKPHVEIFYISFPKNQIVRIHPEKEGKISDLQYRISLKEYLDSYGINVKASTFQHKNQVFPKSLTDSIFQENQQNSYRLANKFRQQWNALRENQTSYILHNQGFINLNQTQDLDYTFVKQALNTLNYTPQIANQLSKTEVQYFVGGWWEEYIYTLIKEEANLSEDEIGLNIEINRDNRSVLQAGNEFDLLFVKNNRLYVIECKTGIFGLNKKTGIQTFNEYVYKLAALRKFFGLSVKLVLLILQPLPTNKQFYYDRTNDLNIQLLDGNILSNTADFIQKLLK